MSSALGKDVDGQIERVAREIAERKLRRVDVTQKNLGEMAGGPATMPRAS